MVTRGTANDAVLTMGCHPLAEAAPPAQSHQPPAGHPAVGSPSPCCSSRWQQTPRRRLRRWPLPRLHRGGAGLSR